MSIARSRAYLFSLSEGFKDTCDFHIHLPENATPKDGPSAGVGLCLALLSSLTSIKLRADVASTGEVTLRGGVLPVGGIKEKLLAAHREGIGTVLIPKDNVVDLDRVPENVKDSLRIIPISKIEQALRHCLVDMPKEVNLNNFSGLVHRSDIPRTPKPEGAEGARV